jgi:transcriptional regulator with XRE-family HTH domain
MSSQVAEAQRPQWTLTDRLRKARELTQLQQKEFADQLGVNRNTVNNYELAKTKPQVVVLRAWAAAAGVDYDWLVEGTEFETRPPGRGLPRRDSNLEPAAYRLSTQSNENVFRVYSAPHSDELQPCYSQAA